MLVTAMLEI
jgi:transposase InsO family protein